MKHILMIGTGGTIASEMTPEGLTPELNTRQLLSFAPASPCSTPMATPSSPAAILSSDALWDTSGAVKAAP